MKPECTTDSLGIQTWTINQVTHREDGPAIIFPDKSELWYQHGKLHRVNGPAFIWPNGYQKWFSNGVLHREDGPAVIWPDDIPHEYWVFGVRYYSFEEVQIAIAIES